MKKIFLILSVLLLTPAPIFCSAASEAETVALPVRIVLESNDDKVKIDDISPLIHSLYQLQDQTVTADKKVSEEKPAVSECFGFIAEKPVGLEEKLEKKSTESADTQEYFQPRKFKKDKHYKRKHDKKNRKKEHSETELELELLEELDDQD